MVINVKIQKFTTREVFYIVKSLKVKYGILITNSLNGTNYNEFYGNLNNKVNCDFQIVKSLLEVVKNLNENLDKLVEEGKKIILEEERFKKLDWPQIVSNLKTIFRVTNRELSKLTDCKYKSIGEWERDTRTPNYENCKKLSRFTSKNNLNLERLSMLKGKKHTYKSKYLNLEPLVLTPELSEFIGILNGDGTISKGGLICITGNHIEDKMHHKIRVGHIIKNLFNKKVRQSIGNSVINSSFTSRKISKQVENLGVPVGRKENIRIPNKILEDGDLLRHYLRGLFDTDGTICRRNKDNIRVGYGSFKSEEFTKDILKGLRKMGFNSLSFISHDRTRVEIISDLEVIRFFKEIGSCNFSKIGRFIYWRLNHKCPTWNYNQFNFSLKNTELNIEGLSLPFLWNKEYLKLQDVNTQKILISNLEEDEIKFEILDIRKNIDWKEKVKLIKKNFKIRELTKEFDCNYKTIWQWQTGTRTPNLNTCVKIKDFCDKNGIMFSQ